MNELNSTSVVRLHLVIDELKNKPSQEGQGTS